MRNSCAIESSLLCDANILRQSSGSLEVTQGDTVHQWAQLSSPPNTAPGVQWTSDGKTYTHHAENLTWDEDGILPRLCAAQRLLEVTDKDQICALATQYQLLTQHTNFILVHERLAAEKAQRLPLLQQVAQMHAAGTAGNGSVQMRFEISSTVSTPSVWRSIDRTKTTISEQISLVEGGLDDYEIPAFLRKSEVVKKPFTRSMSILNRLRGRRPEEDCVTEFSAALQSLDDAANPLAEVLANINAGAYESEGLAPVFVWCLHPASHTFAQEFVRHLARGLHDEHKVWAVLLVWLAHNKGVNLERHARRALTAMISTLTETAKAEIVEAIETAAAVPHISRA
jgi:hypothetical protein